MSEPSLVCSAPALAESAQQIALYSHYAVAVAGFAAGGVMIYRSRVQEKLPHILGAVSAIGIGLVSLFTQWEFNQFLYHCRETAVNAVSIRAGLWGLWSTLILVALAFTPGFRFKRMKKLALIPLIALAVISFGLSCVGESFIALKTTVFPTIDELDKVANGNPLVFAETMKTEAKSLVYSFGIPALVCALGLIGVFVFTQQKKVEKRSQENHQSRTGVMTLVALAVPAVAYSMGMFVAVSARGISGSVLLFNCAEVMSMFFLLCATMSLVGVPANFPKPVKPQKKAEEKPQSEAQPTPLDQQQAYAQYYAQQQAYAQYYAQLQAAQQAAAAQHATTQQLGTPPVAMPQNSVPQTPATLNVSVDPVAAATYQQQTQYYAQQQAYAAYQQQQQAYQQAYAAQQQYAQPQQQAYAQAYQQQQQAYQQSQKSAHTAPHGVKKVGTGAPRPVAAPHAGGAKKVGGVRPVKKIR